MPRNPISMKKIREVLRLKWACQCSNHLIACSIGISSSTVSECLRRAQAANLSWPLPVELDDAQLETLLYPPAKKIPPEDQGEIDWVYIHQELKRKAVTLMLLWQEYRQKYPYGLGHSWFCERYREWTGQLDLWMRQSHKVGEKCFVDYTGMKMPVVVNQRTGETREAEIFVAALGASNFTFAEATWTQQLSDWISSHVRAFEFFGGVSEIIVPDNLKSGVNKAHRYEPELNLTYQNMAMHYAIAIIPTRISAPQDKAKVENAVLQVERQILAKLRDRVFFSLHELNQAIRELLSELNLRPFQKLPGSRQSQFNELEKSALKPLPATRYVYAEWKKVRAGADYHVQVDDHYYSVLYTYAKKELDARFTQNTIEIFYKNNRIASHLRSYKKHKHTTVREHMPKRHQAYAEWTPERIVTWASNIGEATAKLVDTIIASRVHPQQGFRSCLGILRLAKSYGNERLESSALRALTIGAHSYKSVESILKNGLDQTPIQKNSTSVIPTTHEYVRGQDYFS